MHAQVWDNFWQLKALLNLWKMLFISRSFKFMKNAFYFTLKALFVLSIFYFFSWFCGHAEIWLDYQDKVNSKIYGLTTWKTSNCNVHIAKYLKKYNVSTFFLKKHTQNVVEKLVPNRILKIQHWAYLWSNCLKFYNVYYMSSWRLLKCTKTKL